MKTKKQIYKELQRIRRMSKEVYTDYGTKLSTMVINHGLQYQENALLWVLEGDLKELKKRFGNWQEPYNKYQEALRGKNGKR